MTDINDKDDVTKVTDKVINFGEIRLEEDPDFPYKNVDDVKEDVKKKVEEEKNKIVGKGIGGIVGLFSKKPKSVENEDGSISRTLKVGKQKMTVTAQKVDEDTYSFAEMKLDEKGQKKLTERMNKGKKLSADEKLYVNCQDKTAVKNALKAMNADFPISYTKDEVTGQKAVDTFFVNMEGFKGDKTQFAAQVKAEMVKIYGNEAGEKHFAQFAELSGLSAEVQKLADKEKEVPAEEKVEDKAAADEKRRKALMAAMEQDAMNKEPAPVNEPKAADHSSLKESMRSDEKNSKIDELLNRPGMKLSRDKKEIRNDLVEKFGAEAAYNITLKCVVEPLNAMKEMGEKFKRSGASVEYFADLDPNDAEKMAKAEKVAGVPLNGAQKTAAITLDTSNLQSISILDEKEAELKAKPMELNIKSPSRLSAEEQYDKLRGDKELLTIGELLEYGVQKRDFQIVARAKVMEKPGNEDNGHMDRINELAPNALPNEMSTEISKEFAVALIENKMLKDQGIEKYVQQNMLASR